MLVSPDGHRAAQLGLRCPAQPGHPRKKIRYMYVFLIVSRYLLSKKLVLDAPEYPIVPARVTEASAEKPFATGTIKAD